MKKIILCFVLALVSLVGSCGGSGSYGLKLIASYNGATLYKTVTPAGDGNIKVVSLVGSFNEMGRQYGYLLATDLETFYDDVVLDYLVGEKGIPYADLLAEGEATYAAGLADTKEFLQGMAEGSEISLEQIKIINSAMVGAVYGCSAVAAWGEYTNDGPLVVGRNWDMVPLDRFKDYMTVVVYNPTSGNSVADINYLGQIQHKQSAMNDKGLWIDLQDGSMMSSATDDSYQDANDAIIEFLMSASTMEELDEKFMAGPSSASFVMTAASSELAYSYFWCTQGVYRFTDEGNTGLVATSNHYVTYPEEWTINTLPSNPAAQGYTVIRRDNWMSLANSETYRGKFTDETMKAMFETTIPNGGGSFPTSGYSVETVYQIVANPSDLSLWIRLPKYFGWEKIDLAGLFK